MSDPTIPEELTAAERAALEELPRERIPPADLEEAVVEALRRDGVLAGAARRQPVRRWWWAATAAGLALFTSGLATGQWMAGRSTARVVSAVLESDPVASAARVQEAGSAYVSSLARLAELAARDDTLALGPGREAARVALYAATLELTRLSPDDATLQLMLGLLGQSEDPLGEGGRRTIWF